MLANYLVRVLNTSMSVAYGSELVGIATPTCAGKTSLLEELKLRMPASVATLPFDEYDLYPTGSELMERELAEPRITNWKDPALFDMPQFIHDAATIARGYRVTLQTRSRESLEGGEQSRLFVPRRINILEGVFVLLDPDIRALMDLRFYIDIPPDVMVERRLATLRPGVSGNPWDDPEYIKGSMVEGTRKYVLPQREYADVVLDGTKPTTELATQVIGHLS